MPLLLASTAGVAFVADRAKPDYKAVGHLQLIPPAAPADPANAPKRTPNPWLDLGFQGLGNAVILKVQNQSVLDQLVADGYSDNFTVIIEYNTTYLSIEAIGSTRQQAVGTVKQLMKLLADEVAAQQRQFGVAQQDSITTLPLDAGDKVTVVHAKKARILAVAGGVALMFTVAATLGLDALLRRLTRRRRESAAGVAADGTEPADQSRAALLVKSGANGSSAVGAEAPALPSRSVSVMALPAGSSQAEQGPPPATPLASGQTVRGAPRGTVFRSSRTDGPAQPSADPSPVDRDAAATANGQAPVGARYVVGRIGSAGIDPETAPRQPVEGPNATVVLPPSRSR